MNEFFSDDKIHTMYHGWGGKGIHPDAPSGGGGPGFFAPAEQLGVRLMSPGGLPHPASPAAAAMPPNQIKQMVAAPEPIKLTDIPGVMRKKGWLVGAAVMDKWLAAPMRVMTSAEKTGEIAADKYPAELIDVKLITWKWLDSFNIVREAKVTLLERLTVANAKTVTRLRNIMRKNSLLAATTPVTKLYAVTVTNLAIKNIRDEKGVALGDLFIPGILDKPRLQTKLTTATEAVLLADKAAAAAAANANANAVRRTSGGGQPAQTDFTEEIKKAGAQAQKARLELTKFETIARLLDDTTLSEFVNRKNIKQIAGLVSYDKYTASFKNSENQVFLHAHWQFQRATVERLAVTDYYRGNTGNMDDLDAALHVFGLYAAILAGRISDTGVGRPFVTTIEKIGLYMRDTYDFSDQGTGESQYLAHWGFSDVTVNVFGQNKLYKAWNGEYMWPVYNADYRKYQEVNKKGGDLMLFSNIAVINKEVTFDWQLA